MAKDNAKRDIEKLLKSCRRGNRRSQRALYELFYGYAMSICLRYAQTEGEAEEILNDAFLKVFAKLETHRSDTSFKSWFRRIIINAAIDHFRRNQKHYHQLEIAHLDLREEKFSALDKISKEEIMQMVQALPPAYRLSFNLFAIEGFSHQEIAQKLGVSVGTSKSNLFKARARLQKMLKKLDDDYRERYG